MNRKNFFISIAMILFSATVFPQYQTGTISGAVQTKNKRPVPLLTVALCQARDSSQLTTTLTDSNSRFFFHSLPPGNYLVMVNGVGFEPYISKPFQLDSVRPAVALTPIMLKDKSATLLEQVVVTAKRPLLEQQIDRMVVNVDAMIGAAGSNALEILEKTPGVSVELSGTVSLNGKANVMIMIDGRPTHLSPADLATYLKSLPGGTLDKIELIDNPPAKYEAAGNAIINIKLRRGKLQGLTGAVTTGFNQGKYSRSNNSININFNRKKISLTTSVGYNRDGGYVENEGGRNYYAMDGEMISQLKSTNLSRYAGDAISGRITVDLMAGKKTSYGAIANFNARVAHEMQLYQNVQLNENLLYDSLTLGVTNARNHWSGAGANLNFLHKFDTKGRELSGDVNYSRYDNRSDQELVTTMMDGNNLSVNHDEFSYYLPSTLSIYSGQSDYVYPLAKKARIDGGFKWSQVTNDNLLIVDGISPVQAIRDKSNHFIYRESITAVYINARKDWRRFGIQAGLRTENTVSNGNQLGNLQVRATTFRRNYINAFPSLFLTYKLDSMNSNFIDLSYSRRIRRPNYQMLNPFQVFVDNYSYASGNPMLKPQFANQLEIKYRYKKYFGIGVQQGFYNDVIFQITETNDKVFVTTPQNVARGMISALVFNAMIPVAKWWNINFSGNVYRLRLKGQTNNGPLDQVAFSFKGSILNQFTLTNGWNAEINGFYNGEDISGQRIIEPRYRVNAGIQKKLLGGKCSIRATVEDIFYTWKQEDVTHNLVNALSFNVNRSDTRRLSLAFTYSFGKENNSKKRSLNENSASEEKSRVD